MLPDGSFILASAGGELLISNSNGDRIAKRLSTNRSPVYGVTTASTGIVAVGPSGVRILTQH
ncbi:hypothetical protein D3C81_2299160 [compost metagenome]